MKKLVIFLTITLLVVTSVFAAGQSESLKEYPHKPIDLIVPFAPGGGTDIVGRVIADGLSKHLGQPVGVVNIGGAGGAIGAQEVLDSDHDGYTLLFTLDAILTAEATGGTDIGIKDFIPLAQVGSFAPTVVSRYNSPYKNLNELITKDINQGPGETPIATNIGAIAHFQILGIRLALKEPNLFRLVHIGDGSARISQTLGGHVEFTSMGAHEARPYIESKEMKILSLMTDNIPEYLPKDTPTTKSLGIDWEWENEYYVFAPKGTPQDVVKILTKALTDVMNDNNVITAYKNIGINATLITGKELEDRLNKRYDILMNIASVFGLKN
jgi:tripartite-type tricarboxylate transporter receptor subunit TctC